MNNPKIETDLAEILLEIKSDIKEFRKDVTGEFGNIRKEIADFKKEVAGEFNDVRKEIADFKKEVTGEFNDVKKEISDLKVGQAKIEGNIKALDTKVEQLDKRIGNQEFTNRGVLVGLILVILGGAVKLFGWMPNQ